ncbi:MAG: tetratricopeptide repeat protein [Bacillaceae bacterium]|nr:tetratricopeptide repeat protein [Bacillaceae bacterium]
MNHDLNSVLQLIDIGRFEEALSELRTLSKICDHETKFMIAQLYYELGLVDEAKVHTDELLGFYPDEGELYVFMAELLIDIGDEDEAIEMLLEVNESDQAFVQSQLLLADLYQTQGLEEVAEQKLLNAKKQVPDEPVVLFGLGEFYSARGDYATSIPYYKKVLPFQEQLSGTNIHLRLAEAFSANGYFEDALLHYEKGFKQGNAGIDDHFGYGYTAFQIKDYLTAIKYFEKVRTMDDGYSSIYAFLADAYEQEGRIDEAMETLKAGIELDEYNEKMYIQAGKLALSQGDSVGEEMLRKVIAINPSNFDGAKLLMNFLKQEERYEDIIELVDYLTELGETDPLFDWFLAVAKREVDEFEDALLLFNDLYETYSSDSDFLEEYSEILLEAGKREKAIKIMKQAVEITPSKIHLVERITHLEEI